MKSIFTSLLLLAAVISGIAQSNNLDPEKLWALQRVYGEQVSPNGETVIFAQKSYDLDENKGTTHLMSIPAAGGEAKRISNGKESIYEAQWRPDGKSIGYLSNASGSMQLWEMNPDGTEATMITNYGQDISNFKYAPDMSHISFTISVKIGATLHDKHSDLEQHTGRAYDDLMIRHWTQWNDFTHSHIAVAGYDPGQASADLSDIMEGEPFDAPMKPFGGSEQMAWHPSGQSLVYVCKKKQGKEYALSTNSELYRYDISTGKTTNLTEGMMGYENEPSFSPDGQWLTWVSMAREGFEADKNVIWVMHWESGKKMAITSDLDQSFGHLRWDKEKPFLYATTGVKATYQIHRFKYSAKGEQFKVTESKQLTTGDHNINGFELAGDQLIGTMNTMSQPAELYRWSKKNGEANKLSNANADILKDVKMGKVEKRMIKTTDGKDMLTWVIYPPDFDPAKKYPTLLYCQGGPQSAVSQFFSYRWNFQLMASNGYIIVAPNRRGLPTFGQEWNDQISKDWGGQAMKDYLSAIDEVAKEPYVDNDRLGAVGASYGGYSVYYLAGIHDGRFKAFISHCGLYNLESWYASTEEMFFANWDIGGGYWEDGMEEAYRKNSPHRMVQNWDTPIMVIHNELDFRVPLNQGLEAYTAAQLRGIPSKFLYFPDEGHWVLKPQNGVVWHREFFEWLDEYLK